MATEMNTSNPFTKLDKVSNPFADPFGAEEAEGQGETTYVMTKSGPDVDPKELEASDAVSVEVMIAWGETVLHVEHLTPPRSFYVGEEEQKNISCDYFLPSEKLGSPRVPLVLAEKDSLSLVILAGAKGWVEIPGHGKLSLEAVSKKNLAAPCPELSGARMVSFPLGSKARMQVGDLVFRVATVPAGRKPMAAGMLERDWTTSVYMGLSMAVHVGLAAAMAMFMPSLGLAEENASIEDQLYLVQQYLKTDAEPQTEPSETEQVADDERADDEEGGKGQRAKGAEGSMGNPASKNTNGRWGLKGPKDNEDVRIGRDDAIRSAQNFGMIGLINTGVAGDINAPTAPWGSPDPLGNDPFSALGNMWGANIAEAHGAGGLGLSGIGEAGGGFGEGIGLGSIGTIGHGAGLGDGQGIGNGHGRLSKGHAIRSPRVQLLGTTSVNGRLPPEVIQRIVRQNYGRFRVCYEQGLRNNPSLQGRVGVRFIIGRDGAVSNVSSSGSDLPDPGVVRCVVSAYYGLSFPEPDGGIVSVVYPIVLTPSG